jgi:hypothetical protein
MKWIVRWRPSVENDLAALWNHASDRGDIAAAADAIDAALERDPLALGESRGGDTRIAMIAPLVVLFDVDSAKRSVTVWDLWRWPH